MGTMVFVFADNILLVADYQGAERYVRYLEGVVGRKMALD